MSKRILITVAGWDERFLKGCEKDLTTFDPTQIIIFYSHEYAKSTATNRQNLALLCKQLDVKVIEAELSLSDQSKSYPEAINVLEKVIPHSELVSVRFNATTSPRDMIWSVLHYLDIKNINTEFSYYPPMGYGEWLSHDADQPRLVVKRSGIMYPDLPTCLLAISGYDDHRLGQLIRKFEPKKILVGRQTGEQLRNKERNKPEKNDFGIEIEYFDFDSYDTGGNACNLLKNLLKPIVPDYNVIAASLGPKPSALCLFKLTKIYPSIGLVYIPAKEYNLEYADGVDMSKAVVLEI